MRFHLWIGASLCMVVCQALMAQAPPTPVPVRPWVQGAAMHLEAGEAWRLRLLLHPALLREAPKDPGFPKGLGEAPLPTVLIHLQQMRPGLKRLADLAGGSQGPLLMTAAHGPRAGFYLRQARTWLEQASPVLDPLAQREAWLLHYGHDFTSGRMSKDALVGTAVFIPGDLPTRSKFILSLASLNPLSKGVRSRRITLNSTKHGEVQVEQVLGAGGTLNLLFRPEGTWVADRLRVLSAVLDGDGARSFSARPGWGRLALTDMSPSTLASLWLIPRLAASEEFEQAMEALRKRPALAGGNTRLLKGAPSGATLSAALGSGPLIPLLKALTEPDDPFEIPIPSPDASEQARWTAQQSQAHQVQASTSLKRSQNRKEFRKELDRLMGTLDAQSLTLAWQGWTPAPPLSESDKERLKKGDGAGLFNGRGEPGMTPSLSASVPLKPGRGKDVEAAMNRIFQMAFTGISQSRTEGAGFTLHRVRTHQAFTPAWTLVKDTLVLGSDDRAVAVMAEGLLGRAPTLADLPGETWGAAQLDGDRMAKDVEFLLTSYLASLGPMQKAWWIPVQGGPPTADDAAAEVAETFGPFLGLLKRQGKIAMVISWSGAGLEVKPK